MFTRDRITLRDLQLRMADLDSDVKKELIRSRSQTEAEIRSEAWDRASELRAEAHAAGIRWDQVIHYPPWIRAWAWITRTYHHMRSH